MMGNSEVASISFLRTVGFNLCMNEGSEKCSNKLDFDLQSSGVIEMHGDNLTQSQS